MRRRAWTLIARGAAWLATALLVLTVLLHLTIRDRSLKFSPLYYAMPWPVLAVVALAVGAFWLRAGRRWLGRIHLLAGAAFLGCWLAWDWEWHRPPAARGDLRVVQWNVDRPEARVDEVTGWLRAQDADVIGVSEWCRDPSEMGERWRTAFPDYQQISSPGEMLCLVRGEVLSSDSDLLRDGSFATLIRARVRGREVHLLQTDIFALPEHYRGSTLGRVGEIARGFSATPLVIFGDFNTPRNSRFLRAWQAEGLVNAFSAAGRGLAATWPLPLPVLSLDQIWSNPHLRAVRCEHFTSWRSDHRAVVADFDFAP